MTQLFAILMPWGRVGSNLVAATLRAEAGVLIDNEPTTRIRTFGQRDGIPEAVQAEQQSDELERFLRLSVRYRFAGLKLSHRSLLQPASYLGRLREAGAKPILMVRANHLKTAISQLRAEARARGGGPWQSPWAIAAAEDKPGPAPVDCDKAIRLARLFAKLEAQARASVDATFGNAVLEVEYADLAARPDEVLAKIRAWIGMPPADPAATMPHRKATSDDLREDVTNHTDLARAAEAAGLGAMMSTDAGRGG